MSQYPQAPYGGYAPMNTEHPQAQTVLILGIVSLFVAPLGFVAWYMGGKAKKQIAAGAPYRWGGGLQIGYIIGMIVSILAIVGVVLWILMFSFLMVIPTS